MSKQPCEGCPLIAVCNAAENIVNNNQHRTKNSALGGIALTRTALEEVVSQTGCEGAQINQNGQMICPYEGAALLTRSMSSAPWSPNAYEIPLDSLVQTPPTETGHTGQYL